MNARIANRLLHICAFIGITLLCAAFLATSIFVFTQVEAPHPDVIPTFLWNGVFFIMFSTGFAGAFYSLFRLLDEIFFDQSDRRRITGQRQGPSLKKYSVEWRSQLGR